MNPPPIPDPQPKTKLSLPLFAAYVLLAATLSVLAVCALSAQLIRSVDDVLPTLAPALGIDSETADFLADVFSQLDDAKLSVHHEVPALLSFLFALGIGLFLRAGRKARHCPFALFILGAVLIGIVLFALSLGVSVWLTDVNDIRFGDVLHSLSEMIRAGALDSL